MTDAASRRRLNDALVSLHRFANSHKLDAIHSARSGVPLTLAAVGVLGQVVDHGPIRLAELGRRSAMRPAALSRQVRLLEAKRYLTRTNDPGDGRVWVVTATDAGREACRRVRAANDALLAAQLQGWTAGELNHLAGLMERLDADLRAGRDRRGEDRRGRRPQAEDLAS